MDSNPQRSRRRHGGVAAVLVVLSVVAPSIGLAPAAAAPEAGLERVGTLDWGSGVLSGPGGTTELFGDEQIPTVGPMMFVDPGLERGFGVTSLTDKRGGSKHGIRVFDLAGLEPVEDVVIPHFTGDGQELNEDVHAMDPVDHRLFIATHGFPSANGCADPEIYVLDTQALEFSVLDDACAPTGAPVDTQGLWYDRQRDHLYQAGFDAAVETAMRNTPTRPFHLRRLDPATGELDWSINLNPPCNDFPSDAPFRQTPIVRVGDAVYVECIGGRDQVSQGLTARIPLDGNGRPTGEVESAVTMSGSYSVTADPAGNMLTISNFGGNGVGAFVKDLHTGLFAGLVATGSTTEQDLIDGAGLDRERGRLYLRTPSELIVADIRHRPLPAGLAFPLGDPHSVPSTSTYTLPVDPGRGLVFLPNLKEQVWEVYRDDVPQREPAPPPDVDEATADIPEAPGETGRTVSGSANAFGALFLEPGGPGRTVDNLKGFCSPIFQEGCVADDLPLAEGNRVWHFGHVADLALSNGGSATLAAPVHLTDTATAQDLQQEPAASFHDAMVERGWWPGEQVQCSDFGTDEPVSDGTDTPLGDAEVVCSLAELETAASAVAGEAAVSGAVPISFASAESDVRSFVDDELGNVTEASASAYGVEIGPVRIAEIATTATTVAHGRPGTAEASFSRTISGVTAPGFSCQQCDPEQVAEVLNQVLGLRVLVRVPAPDPAYHPEGSDGGYQALVTKDQQLAVSERTVNADPTDTVVGLEIIVYTDGGAGRSRQIFQFAGVHAESHYGIFPLGNFDFNPSGGTGNTTGGGSGSTDQAGPAETSGSAPEQPRMIMPGPSASGTALSEGQAVSLGGDNGADGPMVAPGTTTGGSSLAPAVQAIVDGWRLFVSDPATAGTLAAMLAVLFVPVYLRGRRFSLLAAR